MNENEMTYYKMFKLDNEIDVELSNGNSVHLNPGFYKFNYCLSGEEPEHKFQYSSDRMKWKDCDDFCTSLYEFDMLNEKVNELMIGKNVMTFARLEYVETIYYREKAVPVFLDDYGERVYKGEFQVGFVCYDSFGYSVHKWLEDYSMTGFGAGDTLELDQISSSVKEWAASSRLLPAQTYHDITYDVYNKDKNCFYLYNPGDLACDFTLEFRANQSNLVLSLFEWDEDSMAPSTQASYSQTLTNIPADSGKVVIDTYKRLIYIEHIDGSKEPINDCWTAGNFFQIPTNQDLGQYSILQVSFTGGTKGDNVKITYDYKYL